MEGQSWNRMIRAISQYLAKASKLFKSVIINSTSVFLFQAILREDRSVLGKVYQSVCSHGEV